MFEWETWVVVAVQHYCCIRRRRCTATARSRSEGKRTLEEPVYAASHLHQVKKGPSPVLANGSPGSAGFGSASQMVVTIPRDTRNHPTIVGMPVVLLINLDVCGKKDGRRLQPVSRDCSPLFASEDRSPSSTVNSRKERQCTSTHMKIPPALLA